MCQLLFCLCDTHTKKSCQKQLIEERVYFGLCLQSYMNPLCQVRHGDILTCKHKSERAEGTWGARLWTLKASPSGVFPAARLHLPRKSHQLGTKYLRVWVCGRHFPFKLSHGLFVVEKHRWREQFPFQKNALGNFFRQVYEINLKICVVKRGTSPFWWYFCECCHKSCISA